MGFREAISGWLFRLKFRQRLRANVCLLPVSQHRQPVAESEHHRADEARISILFFRHFRPDGEILNDMN